MELKKCALDAYDVALKPHHPWALKKAAKLAMGLIGSRDGMSKKLRVPDLKAMSVSRDHFKVIGDPVENRVYLRSEIRKWLSTYQRGRDCGQCNRNI